MLPKGWVEATLGDIVEPIETGDPTKRPSEEFLYADIGSIVSAVWACEPWAFSERLPFEVLNAVLLIGCDLSRYW